MLDKEEGTNYSKNYYQLLQPFMTYLKSLADLHQRLKPVSVYLSVILHGLLTANDLLASDSYLIRAGSRLPSLLQSLYVAHAFSASILRLLSFPNCRIISANTILLCT